MTAGEKRKLYKNMSYEQSARKIAVLGLHLAAFMAPVAFVVLFALFAFGGTSVFRTEGLIAMAGTAPVITSSRSFLDIMDEAGAKDEVDVKERAKYITGFEEKLKATIDLIANTKGYSTRKRAALMEEASTTSDFPILFGTVLERTLLAKYSVYGPDWETYIKRGTQNDFRPADAIGVYGLQSGLSEVVKQQEYKEDASLGEGKVSISLKKYGRIFGMSWESLINDDLGAFNDIADRLATAARRTEWREATKLIAAATGPSASLFGATIAHPIDGAAITNKGALAFNIDNLGATANLMRRQLDIDGEPIMIDGFELVVPPALETAMWQALNPAALIASGGSNRVVSTSANVVVQNLNIRGHVNPYLPIIDVSAKKDATWYLFANIASGAAAKLNFLRGHETPELCMKNPSKVTLAGQAMNPFDGNFENDSIFWRVRHILGGAAVDPRFAYAQTGS